MTNELIQEIQTFLELFGFCNIIFRFSVCFIAVMCMLNLFKYLSEKNESNKDIRYRIFLLDGWCLFKQLTGYYLFIAVSYMFLFLETKYNFFLKETIIPFILSLGSFGISLAMNKHTATLDEYYSNEFEKEN